MLCKYFPIAWQIILRNWGSVINYKEEEEEEEEEEEKIDR